MFDQLNWDYTVYIQIRAYIVQYVLSLNLYQSPGTLWYNTYFNLKSLTQYLNVFIDLYFKKYPTFSKKITITNNICMLSI